MDVMETNLAQGAILSQFLIIVVMFSGGILLRRRFYFGTWNRGISSNDGIGWLTLAVAVLTIGSLILSDAIATSWGALFNNLGYASLPWRSVLRFCFIIDAFAVCALVIWTGGSIDSPFQPIWFLTPTLSLFLREPTIWIVVHSLIAFFLFSLFVFFVPYYLSDRMGESRGKFAVCVVAGFSLFVSTFIGIYTR